MLIFSRSITRMSAEDNVLIKTIGISVNQSLTKVHVVIELQLKTLNHYATRVVIAHS